MSNSRSATQGLKLEHVLGLLRRWWWVIVLIGALPTLLLGLRLRPGYSANARLQVTMPPSVEVALYEQTDPYRNLRDELTVSRTDFIEVAKSLEVRARTVAALRLTDADADYSLDVRQVRDSDFIDLSVEARTAELAERSANTHAEAAIQYAAELRALPARATAEFLGDRLRVAQSELEFMQNEAAVSADSARAEQMVAEARNRYLLLLRKLNEAELKSTIGYTRRSMQVVSQATIPAVANTRKVQAKLALAALGSLVAGVLLAMLLDAVVGKRVIAANPVRSAPRITTALR